MNQPTKAVILARVSSRGQEEEGYSLDSQVKLLRAYGDSKGFKISDDEVFKITESASKASQRRTFKDAMKYIEDHKIKHLIIEKVDRHVRNLHDAVETYDWLMADEARHVHFVKDTLTMHKNSRSQEWLNWGIRVVMAKNYIDNLREEAMKGWAEKLAQGWLPAPPPPGYMTITQNSKRIHVPNPTTKPILQRMFKLYLEPSHSINSITLELAKAGVRTRKGRPYSKSYVQKLLNNPFYIGINHFDGKDYPGAQEPIIKKDLFEKVQKKMHRGRPAVYKTHNPVLKNIITCEGCGGVITWQLQKGRYYGACQRDKAKCPRRKFIREDKVEAAIIDHLNRLVCPSPEVIDWVASTVHEQQHDAIEAQERMIASVQTQIDRLERMDAQLYDDKLAGEIPKEKYDEKHKEFVSQKAEFESQRDKLGKSASQGLEKRLVLLKLSQKAASIYQKKTPEQKRLIITKLFSKITSNDDSVSVSYTNFAQAIAQNVLKTKELLGE